MQADRVSEQIKQFIGCHFPSARKRQIANDEPLIGNGIIDSLGVLDVVTYLENEFKINVSDEELIPENFQTVESMAAFVQRKRNGRA